MFVTLQRFGPEGCAMDGEKFDPDLKPAKTDGGFLSLPMPCLTTGHPLRGNSSKLEERLKWLIL